MTYNINCGDCMQLMQTIPDNSIDLIVTDPPYSIDNKGAGKFGGRNYYDELAPQINGFGEEVLGEFCRIMKKINIYIWCSQRQIIPLLKYFVTERKCNFNILSWHKTNPVPTCNNKYLPDTEFCLFFREKGTKVRGRYDTKLTYYITPINTEDKKKYNHPTVKPVQIIKNLIINSSEPGQVILDPFMGTGTTGVACIQEGRDFIGYELNKNFFETAESRLKKASELKQGGKHAGK